MRERQFTARRRDSGYRVRGSTVLVPTDEYYVWKLRDLLWRTSQTGDYRRLFPKLDELIARDAIPIGVLEEHVLAFATKPTAHELLQAWVEEKRLIRSRLELTELQRRLSRVLHLAVSQRCVRLRWLDQYVKRAGGHIVERRQEQIKKLQDRTRRAVVSQRSMWLRGLDQRVKLAGSRIVEERKKRIAEIQNRTRRAWGNAIPSKIVSRIKESNPGVWYQCELDPLDRELVARWELKTTAEDRERLDWARRGEKAALLYYRKGLRHRVADISIQQLDGSTTEWKTHDLQVDGRLLDVKNVRCPRLDRFQEHLWRDHKQNREGDQVGIVGSVSIIGTDGDPEGSLVIGEVTDSDVRGLHEEVNTAAKAAGLSVEIRLDRDWRDRVPGWLFEYPDVHYAGGPDWEDILPRCREIYQDLGLPMAPWLVGLEAARCGLRADSCRIMPNQGSMFGFVRRVGLSRRSLFWFVLLYMLSHRHDPKARHELVGLIFHGDEKSLPLGLHDPRHYVWHLFQTLEEMITSDDDVVGRATNFRLVGANILQARIGLEWHTILAYCGSCGRWPIYWGASEPCPCGKRRLLCDDRACLSCGLDCEGHEYDTWEEAREAAIRLPNWRLIGRNLLPPSGVARGNPLADWRPGGLGLPQRQRSPHRERSD